MLKYGYDGVVKLQVGSVHVSSFRCRAQNAPRLFGSSYALGCDPTGCRNESRAHKLQPSDCRRHSYGIQMILISPLACHDDPSTVIIPTARYRRSGAQGHLPSSFALRVVVRRRVLLKRARHRVIFSRACLPLRMQIAQS